MTKNKGFTLIEIVAVVVVLGVLTSIAIPLYTNMMQQGEQSAANSNLLTIYEHCCLN